MVFDRTNLSRGLKPRAKGSSRQQDKKNANERNDLDAQFQVGHMYAIGNEVSHDPEKSLYWCERAADQYHSKSLCQLGYIYYTGDYVEKKISKAIRLFEEAALLGDDKAFFNLATMYSQGYV
jgi:TPR repeat protein